MKIKLGYNQNDLPNLPVEVTGYSADNCSVSYTSFNNETLVGSVIRSASVLVLPEGLHRTDTQSAYFCANGKWLVNFLSTHPLKIKIMYNFEYFHTAFIVQALQMHDD